MPQDKPITTSENNLRTWNKVCNTDKKFTKTFDKGTFKGTDINPTYRAMKMTEVYGPYGYGWGIQDLSFREIPLPTNDVIVVCELSLWYEEEGKTCVVGPHAGCDFLVRNTKSSGPKADDEAHKKAQTDAMTACFRFLGISADVYMGLWDNSKYQQELEKTGAGKIEDFGDVGLGNKPQTPPPSQTEMRKLWSELMDLLAKSGKIIDDPRAKAQAYISEWTKDLDSPDKHPEVIHVKLKEEIDRIIKEQREKAKGNDK